MEVNIAASHYLKMVKQRNLYLCLASGLMISQLLISAKLFMQQEKIIMVPGLEKQISIEGSNLSSSYIEQMTHSFINLLLDITPEDIAYKKQTVLKFTSHAGIKNITEYFLQAENEYKKFNLSTHYTVKTLDIDAKNLTVTTNGILASWYGKNGHTSKGVNYRLTYEFTGGFLRLKEFSKIEDTTKNIAATALTTGGSL